MTYLKLETVLNSQIDEFFKRGKYEALDVSYISQSYFDSPRKRIRNNRDGILLIKQTLRDFESMYEDIGVMI